MAKLLLKATNSDHPDIAAAYKRGDVVVVMDDDHVWGGMEGLPDFIQIDIPGVAVAELDHLQRPQAQQPADMMAPSTRAIYRMFHQINRDKFRDVQVRRQYQIDLSAVAAVNGHASVASLSSLNKRKQNAT